MKHPRTALHEAPMTALPTLALILLLAVPALAAAEAGETPGGPNEQIGDIYKALGKVELDRDRSVKVENLQVGRDVMDITLGSGRIWFAKPWKEGQRPTAAVFAGEGRSTFTPVNKIEKHQFKKAYHGKDSLSETFKFAFIRFNDDLYDGLKDRLEAERAGDDVVKVFQKRQQALEDLLFDTEFPMIEDYLSPVKRNQIRLVQFENSQGEWVSYFHNPADVEENVLFIHKRVGFDTFTSTSLLSQWHDEEDYARGGDLEREDKDLLEVEHYDADLTVLRAGLVLDASVRMDIRALVGPLATGRFLFITYMDFVMKAKEFKIRAVTLPDGTPLDYIHNNYQLLVQFDKPLAKDEKRSVVVSYTADFIRPDVAIGLLPEGVQLPPRFDALDADAQTFTLLNTFPWFPQYGFLKRYTIDWRIKVPKPFLAVGSGTTVRRWEEGTYNCLHTVEKERIALASWLFGKYDIYTDEKDTARPKIYVSALPKQWKQREALYHEARQVINWYEQWSNPFPYDELDVAQMGFFYGFGQAPPGLVQLTGETFLSAGELADIGYNPVFKYAFVAHEVGHEWFGHVVSWASPHDQWLSESYTEYMSALYVGNRDGQKAFDTKLRQWRDRASMVPDGGSIWLGGRNGKWYFNVTYDKGPYVLHMLRLTMQTQYGVEKGDEMFFASMKAFLDKFRHQNATTNELVQVVNQTTRTDYSGFFNQWFRDVGIPEIKFSYDVRQTEDGKFMVSMKAVQQDKDNIKQGFLPVYLHFGDNRLVRMMPMTKAENTYQIKVPSAPERVTANEENNLLAKVVAEKG